MLTLTKPAQTNLARTSRATKRSHSLLEPVLCSLTFRRVTVACGADFVRELEEGLDTLLGEQGTGLSEGQMQRLSIARAVFADRPVLLLDEATSALDAETEAQLLYNLKQLTDKTIIIVTHRPAALEIADSVIEFK